VTSHQRAVVVLADQGCGNSRDDAALTSGALHDTRTHPACHECLARIFDTLRPTTARIPNDHAERYDRCESCNGTGLRPTAAAIEPPARPAVEIMAAQAA
jgi:hypothetical protein